MTKIKRLLIVMTALFVLTALSACGKTPPKEKQIAEDIMSQGFSDMWIYSRVDVNDPTQNLPYEITNIKISKRDTRIKDGWDTVWFDFTASNTIHEYSGSAYADYKLYSQGGWMIENWEFESYESHPIAEPRFEEFAATWDAFDNLNMPEDIEESKFSRLEFYASAEDAAHDLGNTYEEYLNAGIFPYDQPVATWKYAGKAGDKYGLYTQMENPIYVLGYSSDAYWGDDASSYGSAGWYFYNTFLGEDGKDSTPVTETRTYIRKATSSIKKDVTLTITITEGEPTQAIYKVTAYYYNNSVGHETINLGIHSVEYDDIARASYTIRGYANGDSWFPSTITVSGDTAEIDDYFNHVQVDDLMLVDSQQQEEVSTSVSDSQEQLLPDSATDTDDNWKQKTADALTDYVYGLNDAINAKDFSLVAPVFVSDSAIYRDQKNLVANLGAQGITENVVSLSIKNQWLNNDNTAVVVSDELIGVTYGDGTYKEVAQSYAYHMQMQSDGSWLLYQMIEQ